MNSIDIIKNHSLDLPFPLPHMCLTFTKDYLNRVQTLLISKDGPAWLKEVAGILKDLWDCDDAVLHGDILTDIAAQWDRVYFAPYGGNISGKQMLPWKRLEQAPPVLGSKSEQAIERMTRLLMVAGLTNFRITPSHKPRYLDIHLSNGKVVQIIDNRPNCDIPGFVKRYCL